MIDPAVTAEQRIPELRHSGVRLANELRIAGRNAEAHRALVASVEIQARIAGIHANLLDQAAAS